MIEKLKEFRWELYENNYKGSNSLTPNPNIKGLDKNTKVFSHEPYAQEQFDLYDKAEIKSVKKDLAKGDCVSIVGIPYVDKDRMTIELLGGLSIDIDLNREKRFIQIYGYSTPAEFAQALSLSETRKNFVSSGFYAYVMESNPSLKISLWQGHIKKTKDEFMEQINSPSKAYVAKIINANRGGYFVEVSGVEAFMPGSLAAPNKIMDFQTLVGKEVIVMIEDFLSGMNSFIVSHKKYIEHILPQKIAELDMNKIYSGAITGTSKFGIFAEFGEIFTGLLHHSKMKEETLIKFKNGGFKSSDPINFYIWEISKDNRIILTEESPEEKEQKIQSFIKSNKEKVLEASIAAIMNFGIIININDISGLIPMAEFRKNKISTGNCMAGDKINVIFDQIINEKINFKLALRSK
jgi:predicted RNA-binding protein with RPS1 domain